VIRSYNSSRKATIMAKRKKKTKSTKQVSRRALLKGAGAAVAAITASLFIPRMVHSEVLKTATHPTWDRLLGHIGRQTVGLHAPDRTPELNRWVHGLVMRPTEPQPALLLIGPENSGKRTFHHAMGLLLPDHSVIQYPQQMFQSQLKPAPTWALIHEDWKTMLENAWLIAAEGHPGRFVKLFGADRFRHRRYLKWCLTHTADVDVIPNVQRFEVGLLASSIPRPDLFNRLEDEADAFRQTLFRQRLAA
jgi:hypothetical protein